MATQMDDRKLEAPTEKKFNPDLHPARQLSQETARDHALHVENNLTKEQAEMQLKSLYDRLSRWETIRRFKKAVFACTMMCIAAACEGYQIGLNGNIIANLGFVRNVGFEDANGEWQLASDHTALWGALQSLGQMVGMLLLNPISDRIGRKWTLYVVWVILVANTLIETFTRNFQDWAGAKFLAGVGIGAIQATLPVYVTEWSPVNIRGAMIVAYGVWNTIGNFLAPLVLMICANIDPYDWRTPILTQYAFLGVMLPIFLWLPETAYYYAARGQDEKGIRSLRRVNGNVKGYNVELEYAIIKNIIVAEHQMREEAGLNDFTPRGVLRSFGACLKGINLKRTVGAAWPAILGQLTGLSFLNIYSSFFFRQTGFEDPFQISAILSGIQVAGMLVLSYIVDWIGRRKVVLFGGVWCTIILMLVGVLGQIERNSAVDNALIALVCLWAPVNSSINQVGWTFVGEVASQTLRARTGGLAAAMGVVFGLTFNTSVPVMLNADGADLGFTTGFIFMAFGVVGTVVAIFIVPETSRRNAAEVDELFEARVPPWKMGKYVTDVQKAHQGSGADVGA